MIHLWCDFIYLLIKFAITILRSYVLSRWKRTMEFIIPNFPFFLFYLRFNRLPNDEILSASNSRVWIIEILNLQFSGYTREYTRVNEQLPNNSARTEPRKANSIFRFNLIIQSNHAFLFIHSLIRFERVLSYNPIFGTRINARRRRIERTRPNLSI